MSLFISILLAALSFGAPAFPQTPRVQAEDLRRLTGARWTGALVYVDYGSNKEVSIRSNLTVTQSPGDEASWVFDYEYPDEPKANGKQVVTLGKDGTAIGGETVIERSSLDDGALKVVTERRGKDNNRDALLRFTYLIGASSFSIRKEVRPEGAAEFFERNRYSWKR
ncbi:MAG: hypothetical protein ACRD68_17610 [Pyrinomonadaceae bacterium]